MAIVNGYGTLDQFKTRYSIQGTDALRDAQIELNIQGMSRLVDGYCRRRFFVAAADETRYFTAIDYGHLFLPDDLNSITSIKTDDDGDGTYENTWATTDYLTMPPNRIADITPITWLILRPAGARMFPLYEAAVEIVGKFGYCTLANIPDLVREATLLQSYRWYMRSEAPFGVVGSAEMGQMRAITKIDPDVEMSLSSLMREIP